MFKKLVARISELFAPGMDISYSRVNTYEFCPVKYRTVYCDKKYVPATPAISLGQTIHKTLEQYHQRKETTLDQLIESYDVCWVNEGFTSPQQTLEFYEKGRKMLERYFASSFASVVEIVSLEKHFVCKLGRHKLMGIIDRIDKYPDGTYAVIDYKTHSELWDQAKVDADLQLSVYAIAFQAVFGFMPRELVYYFLAHDVKLFTKRTPEQLAAAKERVIGVARKIIHKEFAPNTANCHRCDFKKSCQFSIV
ncbi:MAG: PD-(D/E)XK nuclease family protein [Elusimicrobia bacterium]|nr:PD-(D/E)XK nuclease family protein [Elusimicrobiota bacterium]